MNALDAVLNNDWMREKFVIPSCRLLLEHGARLDVLNEKGTSKLREFARKDEELRDLLEERGFDCLLSESSNDRELIRWV